MKAKKPKTARLIAIARWLEEGAPEFKSKALGEKVLGFSMSEWREQEFKWRDGSIMVDGKGHLKTCGSTCCIGGAAVAFFGEKKKPWEWRPIDQEAEDLLGLTRRQANALFIPKRRHREITPAQAAKVMRKFIATGEIRWPKDKPL